MLCLCPYGPALLRFWFQTDLGRENSPRFLKIQVGKTFSYHGHGRLVTLYVQFLCSGWSKYDRWVHAENLCNILKLVYLDSLHWSLQSFVSTIDVFNCFFLWMYKMKYSCYQESSVIHGWFVYWVFGWGMRRLSIFGNPISDGIVFVFHWSRLQNSPYFCVFKYARAVKQKVWNET